MDNEAWRRYEDPDGYFSVRFPVEWTIQRVTLTRIGSQHGRILYQIPQIDVSIGPAPLKVEHLIVNIRCVASTNPYRQFNPTPPANTMLGDIPAYHEETEWQLDTPSAHFEITYRLPGSPGRGTLPYGFDVDARPPAEVLAMRHQLAWDVITTFVPGPSAG